MSDFGKFPDFKNFGDQTIGMANKDLFIEFEHVPTGHKTRFKSMITQFRDDFTSEYNTEFAYGRMDPIQTFKRTGRVLSFDFDIPAASMEEAFENLRRMSLLTQFLYPTYSEVDRATSIKAAPIVKVKFLNFIQSQFRGGGLHGTLSGITFAPDMEAGVYEFNKLMGQSKIAPKLIKVSCQLTVLHDHALGWVNRGPQTGFRDYPYNVYPRYTNLRTNEPNNVRSPRGASNNKNVQKAREGFMGPPAPETPLADLKNTGRKPATSRYGEGDITPQDALVNNDIAEAMTSTGDGAKNRDLNAGRFVVRGRGDQVSPSQRAEGIIDPTGELPLSGETGRNRLPGKKGPTRPAKPINFGDGRGSGE